MGGVIERSSSCSGTCCSRCSLFRVGVMVVVSFGSCRSWGLGDDDDDDDNLGDDAAALGDIDEGTAMGTGMDTGGGVAGSLEHEEGVVCFWGVLGR